jgi:hypothetical protein
LPTPANFRNGQDLDEKSEYQPPFLLALAAKKAARNVQRSGGERTEKDLRLLTHL